mgnify:CR=1 FL=1
MSNQPIIIMAGGTGGHVIPALSLAHALQAKGVDVEWLGSQRGIENRLVPNAGIMLNTIAIEGLRGKGLAGWCKAPINLSRAVMQARRIIKCFKPDVVVGLGGFASGPGGLAARLRASLWALAKSDDGFVDCTADSACSSQLIVDMLAVHRNLRAQSAALGSLTDLGHAIDDIGASASAASALTRKHAPSLDAAAIWGLATSALALRSITRSELMIDDGC